MNLYYLWKREEFKSSSMEEDEEVFNCPRLSRVGNRISLVCDLKSSQAEGHSKWRNLLWWSNDNGKTWSEPVDLELSGLVPDKIVTVKKKLLMGYHVIERVMPHSAVPVRLVQMVASSTDNGMHWRDRATICSNFKHDFCEGSIVNVDDKHLICYMRDNKAPVLRSYYCVSQDAGKTWGKAMQMNIMGHRIVAAPKEKEPYKGIVLGTFRNTLNKTVGLFVQNIHKKKTQLFTLDTESKPTLWDYGYTGWAETDNGGMLVMYYIARGDTNPQICSLEIDFF